MDEISKTTEMIPRDGWRSASSSEEDEDDFPDMRPALHRQTVQRPESLTTSLPSTTPSPIDVAFPSPSAVRISHASHPPCTVLPSRPSDFRRARRETQSQREEIGVYLANAFAKSPLSVAIHDDGEIEFIPRDESEAFSTIWEAQIQAMRSLALEADTWQRDSEAASKEEPAEDNHAQRDSPRRHATFLFNSTLDRLCEIMIRMMLARVKVALIGQDAAKGARLAGEALALAGTLDSDPLRGRCAFWMAVSEFQMDAVESAFDWLRKARSARGFFLEGDLAYELKGTGIWSGFRRHADDL